jgi:hypothetical protein
MSANSNFELELDEEIANAIRESDTLENAIQKMSSVFDGSIVLDAVFCSNNKNTVEDFCETAAIFFEDEFGCDTIQFDLPCEASKNENKFELVGRAVLGFSLCELSSDSSFVAKIDNDEIFITLTQKMIDENLPSFVTSGCTHESENGETVDVSFSGFCVGQDIKLFANRCIKQKFISRFG